MQVDLTPHLEAAPTVGILFSKDELRGEALTKLARHLPYGMHLVGGHMSVVAGTDATGSLVQTNSVCPHSRGVANEVGLSLGRFPEANVKSFAVRGTSDAEWQAELRSQGALNPGWKVFLLVGRHRATHEIVEYVQAAHPAAAIIGGMATGESLYRIHRGQVETMREGIVGLMFSGEVPLAAFVSRGARGLGEGAYSFTAEDLKKVDGQDSESHLQMLTHVTGPSGKRQPALMATIESLQDSGQGSGMCIGLTADAANGFELSHLDNRMVVQSQSALLVPPPRGDELTSWSEGQLRFYSFDPDSCKLDLTRRLRAVRDEAERKGERMLGAVMFTCGGRTHQFFGEPAFDASTFARTFEGVPLIGMYAGGEIGPPLLADAPPSKAFQVGGATMHGFTAIFGLFIVPPRQPRASALAFADDAEVAAAFAELRKHAEPVPPLGSAGSSSTGSGDSVLPSSLAELRALPVKALKLAMSRLGLTPTPGSEKEDLVREIAEKAGI